MYAVSYGLHFFAFINYVYIFGLREQCTGHKLNLKNGFKPRSLSLSVNQKI